MTKRSYYSPHALKQALAAFDHKTLNLTPRERQRLARHIEALIAGWLTNHTRNQKRRNAK